MALMALAGPSLAQAQPIPTVTPQQAQQALEILRDPQRRAEILSVLETLARAAPGGAGAGRPAASPSQPAPGTRPAAAPGPLRPARPKLSAAGLVFGPGGEGFLRLSAFAPRDS